jgi:hypothetical protein
MTIDVRATATCNLGPVISASISDDYIQGNGLIKTSGSCELDGIFTPETGQQVVFNYTKQGITRRIPRTLRVLSSFADPFRRTTSIQLGCKLTYLQDLTDPINWDAYDDPINLSSTGAFGDPTNPRGGTDEKVPQIVTVPIHAVSIARKCLQELGISASSLPLTNSFSIAEFDFSSGYVNILSDLLVSESYCGYLNEAETLVIIPLAEQSGSGPLIDTNSLIDIGAIGIGQLPGDAVAVRYSSLKLKAPDGTEIEDPAADDEDPADGGPGGGGQEPLWGADFSVSSTTSQVVIAYQPITNDSITVTKTFNVLDTTKSTTAYGLYESLNQDGSVTRKNLVRSRTTVETKTSIAVAGNIATQYLTYGSSFSIFPLSATTVETFTYDGQGREVFRELFKSGSAIFEIGAMGLDFAYPDGSVVSINNIEIPIERVTVESQHSSNHQFSRTQRFVTWPKTVYGQQSIASAREALDTANKTGGFINSIFSGGRLYLLDSTENTEITGARAQEAPLDSEITNGAFADFDESDPGSGSGSGFSTESKAEIELVSGDRFAQRRIEFNMPYAPDDVFVRTFNGYTARSSDAAQKANKFGRTQNRLLLGNRSGMNIQIAPEKLPNAPFAPVFIEAAGTIALYRVNAASWTMDSTGIVASTDAMFWGTAGRI